MKLTGKGLVSHAKKMLGTPYVYGMKGGKLTTDKLNELAKQYPGTFTASYKKKAKKFIGKKCTDCSGLISGYTGKMYGSTQLYETAKTRKSISKLSEAPAGAVLWKKGHVAVYIGDGYCIEARGIDYGTVKSKVSGRGFTHILTFSFMTYESTGSTKYTTVKKTSGKTAVKWMQKKLNILCTYAKEHPLDVDGIWGSKTQEMLEKYWKQLGWKKGTYAGEKTCKALYNNRKK